MSIPISGFSFSPAQIGKSEGSPQKQQSSGSLFNLFGEPSGSSDSAVRDAYSALLTLFMSDRPLVPGMGDTMGFRAPSPLDAIGINPFGAPSNTSSNPFIGTEGKGRDEQLTMVLKNLNSGGSKQPDLANFLNTGDVSSLVGGKPMDLKNVAEKGNTPPKNIQSFVQDLEKNRGEKGVFSVSELKQAAATFDKKESDKPAAEAPKDSPSPDPLGGK